MSNSPRMSSLSESEASSTATVVSVESAAVVLTLMVPERPAKLRPKTRVPERKLPEAAARPTRFRMNLGGTAKAAVVAGRENIAAEDAWADGAAVC